MGQILFNKAYSKIIPYKAEELIEYSIRKNELDNTIIVVPTGKYSRRLENYAIRKNYEIQEKPAKSPMFFTLSKFIEYCYDQIFNDRNLYNLSEAYRLAFFEEASEKADLNFFSKKNHKLSVYIIQKLANIIYGLKEDGITIEKLKTDLSNANGSYDDASRLGDIIKLYSKYNELLDNHFLDFPEVLSKLIDFIKNKNGDDIISSMILKNIKYILFNGFSEFKSPEIEFISLFSNTNIPFANYLDFSTNNGPLFGNLSESIETLNSRRFMITSPDDKIEKKYLSDKNNNEKYNINVNECPKDIYLRRKLFNTETDIRNSSFSENISIFEAPNRESEIKYIAKFIKYNLVRKNIRPSDICVCMRQPEIYTGIFRDIFSSYKIPVNISDRFELSASPVVTTIFTILDIIYYEYRLEDIHKLLLSTYLDIGDENFQKDNLYEQALNYRIFGGFVRGGASFWFEILKSRLTHFEKQILDIKNNPLIDQNELDSLTKQKNKINKALDDFTVLKNLLPEKKKYYKPNQFRKIIEDIIKNFKITENIVRNAINIFNDKNISPIEKVLYQEAIEKDTKALESFLILLKEMTYITSERFRVTNFTLNELINKLKITTLGQKYQIKEKSNFGVNVTSIEQTRGIPYKIMILCGAVDGEFPMKYRPETFLGIELKNSLVKHLQSERMQFYQFLTNDPEKLNSSKKQFIITYPKSNQTEELVRSSFIDALLKITNLENDNKIYQIEKIKNALSNKIVQKNDKYLEQSKDIPWINMIENLNELYIEKNKFKDYKFEKQINESPNISQSFKDKFKTNSDYIEYYQEVSTKNKGIIELEKLSEESRRKLSYFLNNPVSVSDIELYSSCPYKFFISKILYLPEPRETDISLSPLDRGNLMHKILYNFYHGLQQKLFNEKKYEYIIEPDKTGIPPILPVTLNKKHINKYLQQLLKIAEQELEVYHIDHPYFQFDKETITGTKDFTGILGNWLNAEIQRSEYHLFRPVLFEFSFGMPLRNKKGYYIDAVDLGNLKIKGKVDRIEFFKENNSYNYIIADYKNKLSKAPNNNDIINGNSFQIPIYILAVKNILKEYYNIEAKNSGGVYYGFEPENNKNLQKYHRYILIEKQSQLYRDEMSKQTSQVIQKAMELDEILKFKIEQAKGIVDKISKGIFPVEPSNGACKYCNFDSICRIKEIKNISEESESENI
jgi:ATP-dependent helicase/nuclease subunit B